VCRKTHRPDSRAKIQRQHVPTLDLALPQFDLFGSSRARRRKSYESGIVFDSAQILPEGTADDWGLMDAINHLVTLRVYPYNPSEMFPDDLPKNQDMDYWDRVAERWAFYENAPYPGPAYPDPEIPK
jgi:hypothetical protein